MTKAVTIFNTPDDCFLFDATVITDISGIAIHDTLPPSELLVLADFQKKSFTLYQNSGTKGSEKSDCTINYKAEGSTVSTKTTYFYFQDADNTEESATLANEDSYMTKNITESCSERSKK